MPDDTLLRVHPTQLYETAMALVIWGIAMWLFRRRAAAPAPIALTVLALLAVERFLVEILRAKDDRFFGPFTLAQVISICRPRSSSASSPGCAAAALAPRTA